jgi:cell wall-associated NlpC family hydrolase
VSQSLTGRHRACARPSTPLTPLGAAVTDRAAQVGRGGVIVAMTSGLVLTLAVPGHDSGVARAAAQWIGQLSRSTAAGEGDLQLQVQKPTITPRGQTTAGGADHPAAADVVGPETAARGAVAPIWSPSTAPVTVGVPDVTVAAAGIAGPGHRAPASGGAGVRKASGRKATTRRDSIRQGSTSAAAPSRDHGAVPSLGASLPVRGSAVLALADRYVGVPYRWGGTSPSGFDCSGYVKYVYSHLGVMLPRTAEEQLRSATPIPRSQARPGDVVFFVAGGYAYHNGIYAGDGMIYDAPSTGGFVSKRPIWAATVIYARVTG